MLKIALLLCVAIALIAIIAACSKKRASEPAVLNYDELIMLDAEDLGEGGLVSAYNKDVIPILKRYVTAPAEITDNRPTSDGSYTVQSQGKTYVIYAPGMSLDHGENWGNATVALFDIVNQQLQDTRYRFYALYGGNDLGGMFLDQETYDRAIKSIKQKQEWPYLPKPEPPWYGQQHD